MPRRHRPLLPVLLPVLLGGLMAASLPQAAMARQVDLTLANQLPTAITVVFSATENFGPYEKRYIVPPGQTMGVAAICGAWSCMGARLEVLSPDTSKTACAAFLSDRGGAVSVAVKEATSGASLTCEFAGNGVQHVLTTGNGTWYKPDRCLQQGTCRP